MKTDTKLMIFTGAMTSIFLGYSLLKRKILARHCDHYNDCLTKITDTMVKGGKEAGKVDGLIHV